VAQLEGLTVSLRDKAETVGLTILLAWTLYAPAVLF
jgi:hypothetical protein